MASDQQVLQYIFGGMQPIRGYLSIEDALVIRSVMNHQNATGLGGAIGEIGVYYGRLLLLMMLMKKEEERVFCADLFNIGEVVNGEAEQLRQLRTDAAKLGLSFREGEIYAGDSTKMSAETLAPAGPIRFFSIDGGHDYKDVICDSALALPAMAPHGVISFDDFLNPEYPDVTTSAYDFLKAHAGEMAPFALTNRKLYACHPDFLAGYQAALEADTHLAKIRGPRTGMMGQDLVSCRASKVVDLLSRAADRAKVGGLLQALY